MNKQEIWALAAFWAFAEGHLGAGFFALAFMLFIMGVQAWAVEP